MTRPFHEEMRLVADICSDPTEVLALSLMRFLAAGYSTGDVACWDAALSGAEQVLGPEVACRLVSGLMGLMRALRAERIGGWTFLPATCCRATADEATIMHLIAEARAGDPGGIRTASAALAKRTEARQIEDAARFLAPQLEGIAALLPQQLRTGSKPRLH